MLRKEGEEVGNEENLKGYGFHERTPKEQREIARKGGKASGEARRKKANFRKTLNALLTTNIDNPEWTPVLNAMGLESTLESAVNAAIIKEALKGNVKAYIAIRDTIGQTTKSEQDTKAQEINMERIKAQTDKMKAEQEQEKEEIQVSFEKASGENEESENETE